MAISLIATPEPANIPPRVLLELTGAAGTTVVIQRQDASGNTTPVRTANPAALTAGAWIGYDYEAPFSAEINYVVVDEDDHVTFAHPLPVDVRTPWLIHPGIPSLSVPVLVESRGDRTRTVNRGVHAVMGRSTPVVITDGVRGAPTFDLTVRTENLADEAALDGLLDEPSALLLQIIYPDVTRTSYEWVSIGDVSTSNIVDFFGNEYTRWVLPCTVTSPPTGLLQAEWTWAGLVANYATWQDVVNIFPTWSDVVTNSPA